MNEVVFVGTAVNNPTYSHTTNGRDFYIFTISVKRNSDYCDMLECIVPGNLSERIVEGKRIKLLGQVRTRHYITNGKSKLEIRALCNKVYDENIPAKDINMVTVTGFVCQEIKERRTPKGRLIADVMLSCERYTVGTCDYVPCIVWGKQVKIALLTEVGAEVEVKGRMQSREYLKRYLDGREEIKTAYEVSVGSFAECVYEDEVYYGEE